jgi:hypothetical protein
MKRTSYARLLIVTAAVLAFASCNITVNGNGDETGTENIPEKYKEFYSYPIGRKNASGTLEIRHSSTSSTLLFTDKVDPANYIGTVEGVAGSIRVKLPEQKFYTIVAVDKATWEERGDQAAQYSDLTYYSNTQPYSMSVQTSATFGGGQWVINNNTSYWVSFRKSDQSGIVYAVAPPNAKLVTVPVQLNVSYSYTPHFYKELKLNGVVVALVESDDARASDTVYLQSGSTRFVTDIGGSGVNPSTSIKPAIFFSNTSDKSVQVYQGQNNMLSNGAAVSEDFWVIGGRTELFTGLETSTNTNSIQFYSTAFPGNGRVYVTHDMAMQNNKVYKIILSGNINQNNYSTTVTEEDASVYYD